jgi:hypothetical protein
VRVDLIDDFDGDLMSFDPGFERILEPCAAQHGGPTIRRKRSGGVVREIARESTTARVECARISVWPVSRFDSNWQTRLSQLMLCW